MEAMLQFFVGLVIGVFVGFCVCAVISVDSKGKNKTPSNPSSEELGENSDFHE